MRPGQLTPENGLPFQYRADDVPVASMRPGQLTPENSAGCRSGGEMRWGFNEAGAINPGKRIEKSCSTIDEYASMRPGQLTPENVDQPRRLRQVSGASMRPGQLTPENV